RPHAADLIPATARPGRHVACSTAVTGDPIDVMTLCHDKTMGIREVTRHTSKVIHEAAAGETVVSTEHDRPIAMLVPLPDTGDPAVDQLIREGKLSPESNRGEPAALLAIMPVAAGDDSDTADVVSDLRADRM